MCLSVRPYVFYLLLDHWRDRNETFMVRRHKALDCYYILKTFCYWVNFKVIWEKLSHCLILVAHIHTYLSQETAWPTSYLPFYLLPPASLSTSYLQPPFLPPNYYLQPSFLPSTSYLPFYLLLSTSYLLPLFLPPTFYLLSPFLPSTSLSTSYLPFYLLPPFLPPNVDKYKVLHISSNNQFTTYTMNGSKISKVNHEKDLGITISNDLKPNKNCSDVVK